MVRSFLRYDEVALTREPSVFQAAANGDEEVLKKYLSDGRINMNRTDGKTGTPLAIAASKGHTALVKLLLGSDKVDVNESGWNGHTPLAAAACKGYEAVVKLLLGSDKVDVNGSGWNSYTPLLAAACNGHEAIVKLLLGNDKVDVNIRGWNGYTPLVAAARNGHEAIVKLLGSDKVDVNKSGWSGQTSLEAAACNGHEAIVKLLLGNDKVDVNIRGWNGYTPLVVAARNGHEAIVKLLLGNDKVDVNGSDWNGYTPLAAAACNGHEAVVKLLLGNDKVDVKIRGWYGYTPLAAAACNGHEAIVRLLISNNQVDVNAQHWLNSATALWLAIQEKQKTIVQMLLADDRISVGVAEFRALVLLLMVDVTEAVRTSSTTALTSEDIAILTLLYKKCAGFNPPSTRQQQAMVAADALLDTSVFVAFVLHIMQLLILRARRLEGKLQKGLSNHLDDLSVFPNRRRPPCTTMPWNIWPALVVLWGVCWMFYNSLSTPFAAESYTNFSVGTAEADLENLSSNLPLDPLSLDAWERFGQAPDPQSLSGIDSSASNLGFGLSPQQYGGFDQLVSREPWDTAISGQLVQTAMPPDMSTAEDNSWLRSTTTLMDRDPAPSFSHADSLPTPDAAHIEQTVSVMAPSMSFTAFPSTLLPTHVEQNITPPQPTMNHDETLPLYIDPQASMICDRDGCSSGPFATRNEWKRHVGIHDRSYKCPDTSCAHYLRGFAAKGDLDRHKVAKHPELVPRQRRKEFYCSIPGCHRSIFALRKAPFTRRDHLQQHIRRIHNRGSEQAPILGQEYPLSNQQRLGAAEEESGDSFASPLLQATASSSRNRIQMGDSASPLRTEVFTTEECCNGTKEVQELRREIADLRRRLEGSEAREREFKAREADSKAREERLFDLLCQRPKPPE